MGTHPIFESDFDCLTDCEIVRSKMNLVRQQFIWSHKNETKNDSKMFQVYKLTVAAYLISMSFYGWRDQKLNPKNIHGSHCYTDYVSNWSDVVCSIWAIISAYIAIVPNASKNIERLLAAFNSIAPTWSIGVSGAFWFLLPKDRQTLDLVSLNQHAFLAIICLVDLLITNSRIRIKDLIPAWLFATAYAANTILVWLIFGQDRDAIYPMIDYTNKFNFAIQFNLVLIFGVQTAVFLTLYIISTIKHIIYSSLMQENLHDNKKQN